MKSSISFLLLPLAINVLASTVHKPPTCKEPCLTDSETSRIIADFTKVVSLAPGYEAVARRIIDQNFISISDSVNFVDQIPLNTTMTHSVEELLEQEAKLPPAGQVKDLFISNTCDTITWYFEFATKPLPTRGIAILFIDLKTRKIWRSFREANIGAVLTALGKPECKDGFKTSVGKEGVQKSTSGCRGKCGAGYP